MVKQRQFLISPEQLIASNGHKESFDIRVQRINIRKEHVIINLY